MSNETKPRECTCGALRTMGWCEVHQPYPYEQACRERDEARALLKDHENDWKRIQDAEREIERLKELRENAERLYASKCEQLSQAYADAQGFDDENEKLRAILKEKDELGIIEMVQRAREKIASLQAECVNLKVENREAERALEKIANGLLTRTDGKWGYECSDIASTFLAKLKATRGGS